MLKEIIIPDLGEGIDTVEVGEVHIKPGDTVAVDDILIVLETEKASMEIPAEEAGEVKEVLVKTGGQVKAKSVVARIEVSAVEADDAPAAKPDQPAEPKPESEPVPELAEPETPAEPTPAPSTPEPVPAPASAASSVATSNTEAQPTAKVMASPAIRRFARELGADLTQVRGSGPKGRISKEDIQNFIKERLKAPAGGITAPSAPDIDFSKWGPVSATELSKIRKSSARNLQGAWLSVPLVTQFDEADITELEAFRKASKAKAEAQGARLSVLPFIMKAVEAALVAFPDFNSSLDSRGETLIHKEYINLGIAVDTPNGLVVPVIKDVDKKSLIDLAVELADVSQRTRDRKILPAELTGATFSISSLGGISGTGFTPLVNPPEVGIMGVSRSKVEPVWNGSEFLPRTILPFSVSYDHRVIDGAVAARFTAFLSEQLSDIRNLLL